MVLNLFVEQVSVLLRMKRQEGLSEAGRESGGGLFDSLFSACDFGGVSRVEMVDGLFGGEFGDWRQD